MIESIQRLFETTFMPHGHCYLWQPGLLWMHVGSDALITSAYFVIPVLMIWFVRERDDLTFKWMFVLFGVFIFLCGATHLLRIVTVWHGIYWVEGGVKLLTGAVSVATAGLLVPLLPQALQLPTPTELRRANEALQAEVEQRKRAEAKLEEAYEGLKETERLKDEFVANVSHELRTPLTLILSPVETMLSEHADATSGADATSPAAGAASEADTALSRAQRTKLRTIHNNAIRLLQMVNGLLDFSQLELGEVTVEREPVDIEVLTRQICQDLSPHCARKGLTMQLDAVVEQPLVEVDDHLFERILFNLLSNAVKFTPSGGEVEVSLRQEADRMELVVSDTGEGIPADGQEVIFEAFRQADASSTRRYEGTGLGLPLVKRFAELLNGDVDVASTANEGSTFTVTFRAPVASETGENESGRRDRSHMRQFGHVGRWSGEGDAWSPDRASEEIHLDAEAPVEREGLPTVVLAEDHEELSNYIRELLKGICHVHLADDGDEAMRLVDSVNPDLVIADIMMPKTDGLTLCRHLKANPATAGLPVVMLTALTSRDSLLRGWEAGADEYLFKPFHPTELVTRIRTLLENVRRRDAAERAQRELEQEVLRVSEHERRQIGQELHDGLASHLTGVSMLAQSLLKARESETDELITADAAKVERIVNLSSQGAEQARAMARGLNPVKLDDEGLPAALETLAEDQERQFDIRCTFEHQGELPDLSPDVAINLYWIAHESVRNAIKHAEASHVTVRLVTGTDEMTLEISDDGTGLPEGTDLEGGMGFTTMRYRADMVGARLRIRNRRDGGVRVVATLALTDPALSTNEPSQ